MRIYEATLYEKPNGYTKPIPIRIDGQEVSREIVAKSAGKARYDFFLDLREAWGDSVRFQDIHVRSLSRDPARQPLGEGWEIRLKKANDIIRVIGSCGRRFFSNNSDRREPLQEPQFSNFCVDKRNELWYVTQYSRKPILIRHREWLHFPDGGTLRSVVESLANYIRGGYEIPMRQFGPFPEWVCGGDLWGYGEDMQKVRDGIKQVLEAA